jgi:hypothetical protein
MDYKGTKIMVTSGDIAATSTASAAISMPWWMEQLPTMLAPFVALAGFAVVAITLAIKINEYRLSRIKLREAEEEGERNEVRFR